MPVADVGHVVFLVMDMKRAEMLGTARYIFNFCLIAFGLYTILFGVNDENGFTPYSICFGSVWIMIGGFDLYMLKVQRE